MKTLLQLRTSVSGIIQDASYSDSEIDGYINDAIWDVCGTVYLPKLETITTVGTTVSQNYSSLPSNFHRTVHRCFSTTNNRKIKVYKNVPLLLRHFYKPDQAGSVVGVAVKGDYLFYMRIPSSAETLQIHYSANPTLLSSDSDEPDYLPDHLVKRLLVSHACAEIYDEIEDGIEGRKVNTESHRGRYEKALADLVSWVGPDALNPYREPQYCEDEMELEAFL